MAGSIAYGACKLGRGASGFVTGGIAFATGVTCFGGRLTVGAGVPVVGAGVPILIIGLAPLGGIGVNDGILVAGTASMGAGLSSRPFCIRICLIADGPGVSFGPVICGGGVGLAP